MLAARVELLQQMPIFGAVAEDALEFLLAPAPLIERPAGGFFFRYRPAGVSQKSQVVPPMSSSGSEARPE